jgi:hypothetical protein
MKGHTTRAETRDRTGILPRGDRISGLEPRWLTAN